MLNIDIEFDNFDELMGNMRRTREFLTERGVQQYFSLLLGDGDISINSMLRNNIQDLVYNSPVEMIVGDEYRKQEEPNFYERTQRLLNSAKVALRGNKIELYMDDSELGNRGNIHDITKGTATNLDELPYSLRVENDFIYENNYGVDVLRKGSKYMRKTYEDIKEDIFHGRKNPKEILTPLKGMWNG